jgi:hypothetical protein
MQSPATRTAVAPDLLQPAPVPIDQKELPSVNMTSKDDSCRDVRTYEVDLRLRGKISELLTEAWGFRQGRRRDGRWSMSVSPTGECYPSNGGWVRDPERRPLGIDNPVFATVVRQVEQHRENGGRVILGTDGAVCAACKDVLVGWPEVPARGMVPVQPWAATQRRRDAS